MVLESDGKFKYFIEGRKKGNGIKISRILTLVWNVRIGDIRSYMRYM